MKERILAAYDALKRGEAKSEIVTDTLKEVKAFARREDKVFDMTCVSDNIYEAGSIVYPFYMSYETDYNGKAGYFDLMDQLRALSAQVDTEFTLPNAAFYLSMMVKSIAEISPQIYELYYELVVLLKDRIRKAIEAFQDAPACEEKRRIGVCIEQACEMDLILGEKYLETAKGFQA